MTKPNFQNDDAKLRSLLRENIPSPSLPPRFQDAVWRRIESAESGRPSDEMTWLDALVALILRPRFAFATALALVLAGALFGASEGAQVARHESQARYLNAVAPNGLR